MKQLCPSWDEFFFIDTLDLNEFYVYEVRQKIMTLASLQPIWQHCNVILDRVPKECWPSVNSAIVTAISEVVFGLYVTPNWEQCWPLKFVFNLDNRQLGLWKVKIGLRRTLLIPNSKFSLPQIIFGRRRTRWRWTPFKEFNFEHRRVRQRWDQTFV